MSALLATLEKNSAEEIRFNLDEWKGSRYLDIRCWLKPAAFESSAAGTPTKKGIKLNVEQLPELIETLQKISRDLAGDAERERA